MWHDAGAEIPIIRTVEPTTAKPRNVGVASGTALARTDLAELDQKLEVLSRSTNEIKFKVPEKTPVGWLCLMPLTVTSGMLIEQLTYLTIR